MKSSRKKLWLWILGVLALLCIVPPALFQILNATLGATPLPPRPAVDAALLAPDTSEPAPLAVIESDQACLQTGETLNVSGHESSDPQGKALTYSIDFGDGTVVDSVKAEHVFSAPGAYRVTLTTVNSDGASDLSSRIISVGAPSFETGLLDEIAFKPNYYDPRILELDEPPTVGGMIWGFFNATTDAAVTDVVVNGTSWKDPSSVVTWCEVTPPNLKEGEIGIVRCMSKNDAMVDGVPISLQVETDKGTVWKKQDTLQADPLALSYVVGRPDGSELLVYVRNDDANAPLEVTGLLLNGQDVSNFAMTDEAMLEPGRTAAIRVPTCGGIAWGERVVITVLYKDGATTQPRRVTRELRLFPPKFVVGNWNTDDVFTDPAWRQVQREAGINMFIWFPSAATPPELVLPMAEAEDFYVFTHADNPWPEYIEAAKNWGDHPRWFMNAVSGEPEIGQIPSTDVLKNTQAQINLLESDKPLWIYNACSYLFGEWASMADIGGMDHYAVWAPKCNMNWPPGDSELLPDSWDNIELVGYYTLAAKRAAEPRPIINWSQALVNSFNINGYQVRCNTPAEVRSQWYQNLGWGSKAMLYYHFLQEHDPACPEEPEQEMVALVKETNQFSDLIGIGEMVGNAAYAWSYDDKVDVVATISPDGLVLVVSNFDYTKKMIFPYTWRDKTNVEIYLAPPAGFEPSSAWLPQGDEFVELDTIKTVGGFYKITLPSLSVAHAVIIEPEP